MWHRKTDSWTVSKTKKKERRIYPPAREAERSLIRNQSFASADRHVLVEILRSTMRMYLCVVFNTYNGTTLHPYLFLWGIHLNISFGQKQTRSWSDWPPVDCRDGRLCKETNIFAGGLFSCEKTNSVWCCYGEWSWVKSTGSRRNWNKKHYESFSLLQGQEEEREENASWAFIECWYKQTNKKVPKHLFENFFIMPMRRFFSSLTYFAPVRMNFLLSFLSKIQNNNQSWE